ncbi:WD40 repeat protein [Ancylomarina subtilis]|uniref:WD40 repeat protein n=1 Tax=Ancylomarina subtilis TaxID=1639035 RepID=A0A4Q7VDA4_9BACT|nr:PD40 domain-containing protein [Ancylomarina subtilis]RZT93353.1 WD40 repeat protein [Ancylomarina subtilis]
MMKLNSGIHKKTSTQLLRTFLFFIIIAIGVNNSYASYSLSSSDKTSKRKKTKMAEMYFANKNYGDAAPILYDLLLGDRKNPEFNNMLGVCYFNLESEKEKSTEYLEKAIRYSKSKNNIPLDYYYNLGKSYHINYQFSKAIRTYNNLLNLVPRDDAEYIADIEHELEICRNALQLTEHPVNITVENLGNLINTEYAEHSPGVTADETTMVFTSRRNGTGSKVDKDGQFFEDIYISHQVNGVWTEPKGISILNTKDHDASISISADGQEIYVYKAGYYNNNESNGGDIYVSKLNGTNWTRPQKLHSDINSPSKESHISVSADGRTIYFSSNRPGGYGKMDIYSVKKLPNGQWGPAQNLGPNINTIYDDDAPFIHHDGKTLYFSSKGHKTMGGFDIFKSTFENGHWNKPVNIGFPINSTKEDIYFTPTPDGKRAYMASYRKGSYGRADIFRIQTPDTENTGLFVLKGKLINTKGKPVGHAKIKLSYSNKTVGLYRPNTASGKFLFIIDAGKQYNLEVRAKGYRPLSTVMNVPAEYANKENHSVITLLPLSLRLEEEEDYPEDIELIDYNISKISLEKTAFTPEIENDLEVPKLKEPLKITPTIKLPAKEKPVEQAETVTTVKEEEPVTNPIVKIPDTTKTVTKNETYYTIQILALQIPMDPEMFSYLDNVKIFQTNDGLSRYTYKKFKSFNAATQELNRLIRIGYWDSFIRTVINGQLIHPKMNFSTSTAYTIQLMSLKEVRPVSYFKNLDGVHVYRDSENIYRYTYKIFPNKTEAQLALGEVLKKSYWDAFVRKAYWGEEVLFSDFNAKKSNKYTIQIMALNHPKSLNYFKNLPIDRLNLNKGKDGLSRYTYEAFDNKKDEKTFLNIAFKKGYYDAFTRTIKWYNKN